MAILDLVTYTNILKRDLQEYVRVKALRDLGKRLLDAKELLEKSKILEGILRMNASTEELEEFKEFAIKLEEEQEQKEQEKKAVATSPRPNVPVNASQNAGVEEMQKIAYKKQRKENFAEYVAKYREAEIAGGDRENEKKRQFYSLFPSSESFFEDGDENNPQSLYEKLKSFLDLTPAEAEEVMPANYKINAAGLAAIEAEIEKQIEAKRKAEEDAKSSSSRLFTSKPKTPAGEKEKLSQKIQNLIDANSTLRSVQTSNPTNSDRASFLIDRVAKGLESEFVVDHLGLDFSEIARGDIDLNSLDEQIRKSQEEIDQVNNRRRKIVPDNLYALDLQFPKVVKDNAKLKEILQGSGLEGLQNIIDGSVSAAGAADVEYEKVKDVFGGELTEEIFDQFFAISAVGNKLEFLPHKKEEMVAADLVGWSKAAEIIILTEEISKYQTIISGSVKRDFESIGMMQKGQIWRALISDANKDKFKNDILEKITKYKEFGESDQDVFLKIFQIKRQDGVVSITINEEELTPKALPEKVQKIEDFVDHVNVTHQASIADGESSLITALKGKPVEIVLSDQERECFVQVKKVINDRNYVAQRSAEEYAKVKDLFVGELTEENFDQFFTINAENKLELLLDKRNEIIDEENIAKIEAFVAHVNESNAIDIFPKKENLLRFIKGEQVELGYFYSVDSSTKLPKLKPRIRTEMVVINSFARASADEDLLGDESGYRLPEAANKADFDRYARMKKMLPSGAVFQKLQTEDIVPAGNFEEDAKIEILASLTSEKEFKSKLKEIWKKYEEERVTTSSAPEAEEQDPVKKSMIEFVISVRNLPKPLLEEDLNSMRRILSSQQFRDLYDQSFRYIALKENNAYEYIKSPKITSADVELYEEFNKSYLSATRSLVSQGVTVEELGLSEEVKNKIVEKFKERTDAEREKFSLNQIESSLSAENKKFYELLFKPFFKVEDIKKSYVDLLIIRCEEELQTQEVKNVAEFLNDLKKIISVFESSIKQGTKSYEDEIKVFNYKYSFIDGLEEDEIEELQIRTQIKSSSQRLTLDEDFITKCIELIKSRIPVVPSAKKIVPTIYHGYETLDRNSPGVLANSLNSVTQKLVTGQLKVEEFFSQCAEHIGETLEYPEPLINCLTAKRPLGVILGCDEVITGAVFEIVSGNRAEFSQKLEENSGGDYERKSSSLKKLLDSKSRASVECAELEKKSKAVMDKAKSQFLENSELDEEESETAYLDYKAEYEPYSYLGLSGDRLPREVLILVKRHTPGIDKTDRSFGSNATLIRKLRELEADKKALQDRLKEASAVNNTSELEVLREKLQRMERENAEKSSMVSREALLLANQEIQSLKDKISRLESSVQNSNGNGLTSIRNTSDRSARLTTHNESSLHRPSNRVSRASVVQTYATSEVRTKPIVVREKTISERLAGFSSHVNLSDFTIKLGTSESKYQAQFSAAKDGSKYYAATFVKGTFDENLVEKNGDGTNKVKGSGIFNDIDMANSNFRACKFIAVDFSKMSVTSFRKIKFVNCNFEDCVLPRGVNLTDDQFKGSRLVVSEEFKQVAHNVYEKGKKVDIKELSSLTKPSISMTPKPYYKLVRGENQHGNSRKTVY